MPHLKPKKRRPSVKGFKRMPKAANGGIELLLIQSVDHLGKQGDVVSVRPGFANNYLLPQGLATVATDHHKRMVEKHREKLVAIEKARLKSLLDLAAELGKQSVTIEANASDEGHLYGSVSASDIVGALKAMNIDITRDQLRMEGVLKEVGLYSVKVRLHSDVEAEIKVWVVPTSGEDVVPRG
ncbi:MAG: 50S ribosomal protein L9 [Pirellulaceae bacterium]|nr:50S ribosomal protein L9 [Pirellulaceae bacterium]